MLRIAASVAGAGLLLPCAGLAQPKSAPDDLIEAGRRIYDEGTLTSGETLVAIRQGRKGVIGAAAACVHCHRRSGYGLVEGSNVIPPIAGPVLFANQRLAGAAPRRHRNIKVDDYEFRTRPAYNDATLAQVIRTGNSQSGQPLAYLMPRYALGVTDMAALIAYLRQLSASPSAGIDDETVHFATIIDASQPVDRQRAVTGVLEACMSERYPLGRKPGRGWRLHVWRVEGPAQSWDAQLTAKLAERPVFAVISGLGVASWEPVHALCERERLPCLFPNVDLPGSTRDGSYSFYFSRGVGLEAAVAARYLMTDAGHAGIERVVQVLGDGESARKAAIAFRVAATGSRFRIEDRAFTDDGGRFLSGLGTKDALLMWLSEEQLKNLTVTSPPPVSLVLASGWLGGLEKAPLTPAWRSVTQLIYPFDAPDRWDIRMSRNLRPWLLAKGLSGGDERLKGNTLAACNVVAESMARARGILQRDFLVELVENYPSGMGNAPAPQAYPRFTLGPGQRFSSKGAYIARFARPTFERLERVRDWIVP